MPGQARDFVPRVVVRAVRFDVVGTVVRAVLRVLCRAVPGVVRRFCLPAPVLPVAAGVMPGQEGMHEMHPAPQPGAECYQRHGCRTAQADQRPAPTMVGLRSIGRHDSRG